jgi:hypothetical protein
MVDVCPNANDMKHTANLFITVPLLLSPTRFKGPANVTAFDVSTAHFSEMPVETLSQNQIVHLDGRAGIARVTRLLGHNGKTRELLYIEGRVKL